jgi:hypothetical protein
MKRPASAAVAAAFLFLLVGRSGAADFPGIAVSAPSADNWLPVQRNAHAVVWVRRTGIEDLTMAVALLTQSMAQSFATGQEFLDWVTASKEANPDPSRFRLVSNRVAPAAGEGRTTCVTYVTVIEDLSGGPGGELRLEVSGLACLHPEQPMRYYDIQYSARMPVGASLPAELSLEGQQFVDSVRFSAPPPDGDWSLGEAAASPRRREAT